MLSTTTKSPSRLHIGRFKYFDYEGVPADDIWGANSPPDFTVSKVLDATDPYCHEADLFGGDAPGPPVAANCAFLHVSEDEAEAHGFKCAYHCNADATDGPALDYSLPPTLQKASSVDNDACRSEKVCQILNGDRCYLPDKTPVGHIGADRTVVESCTPEEAAGTPGLNELKCPCEPSLFHECWERGQYTEFGDQDPDTHEVICIEHECADPTDRTKCNPANTLGSAALDPKCLLGEVVFPTTTDGDGNVRLDFSQPAQCQYKWPLNCSGRGQLLLKPEGPTCDCEPGFLAPYCLHKQCGGITTDLMPELHYCDSGGQCIDGTLGMSDSALCDCSTASSEREGVAPEDLDPATGCRSPKAGTAPAASAGPPTPAPTPASTPAVPTVSAPQASPTPPSSPPPSSAAASGPTGASTTAPPATAPPTTTAPADATASCKDIGLEVAAKITPGATASVLPTLTFSASAVEETQLPGVKAALVALAGNLTEEASAEIASWAGVGAEEATISVLPYVDYKLEFGCDGCAAGAVRTCSVILSAAESAPPADAGSTLAELADAAVVDATFSVTQSDSAMCKEDDAALTSVGDALKASLAGGPDAQASDALVVHALRRPDAATCDFVVGFLPKAHIRVTAFLHGPGSAFRGKAFQISCAEPSETFPKCTTPASDVVGPAAPTPAPAAVVAPAPAASGSAYYVLAFLVVGGVALYGYKAFRERQGEFRPLGADLHDTGSMSSGSAGGGGGVGLSQLGGGPRRQQAPAFQVDDADDDDVEMDLGRGPPSRSTSVLGALGRKVRLGASRATAPASAGAAVPAAATGVAAYRNGRVATYFNWTFAGSAVALFDAVVDDATMRVPKLLDGATSTPASWRARFVAAAPSIAADVKALSDTERLAMLESQCGMPQQLAHIASEAFAGRIVSFKSVREALEGSGGPRKGRKKSRRSASGASRDLASSSSRTQAKPALATALEPALSDEHDLDFDMPDEGAI